jgi:hypothetical protein
MTRLISEGFEAGDLLCFETTTGGGNSATGARIGGRCFSNSTTGTYGSFVFAAASEIYIHVAVSAGNAGTLGGWNIKWFSGTTELGSIRCNSTTGFVEVYTGTATLQTTGNKPLPAQIYYVIEIHVKISDAGGIIEYKIDGVLQSSYTFSGDTKPGADTTVDHIRLGMAANNATFDDFTLNDTNGIVDNSWCGDTHFYALPPTGNGDSSQLSGSDGNSVDNYALVDEIPSNSDTDYVESATSGNKDLYTLTDLPTLPSGATIKRVIVETRAKETTAAGDSINLGVKTGLVESWSGNIVVGTSYAKQAASWATNPDTLVAWTESDVNALKAGVKVT